MNALRAVAAALVVCFATQAVAQDAPRSARLVPQTSAPPLLPAPEGIVDSAPLYTRWWFWVGIGGLTVAAAAGIAVAIIFSSISASPPPRATPRAPSTEPLPLPE